MSDKPARFPATCTMTVDQTLNSALNLGEFLEEVIVIGWNQNHELVVLSSRMTRRDALWLIEQARIRTLDIQNYQDDRAG